MHMISLKAPNNLDRYISAIESIMALRTRPVRLEGEAYVSLEHIQLCLKDRGIHCYREKNTIVVPKFSARLRQDIHGLDVCGI